MSQNRSLFLSESVSFLSISIGFVGFCVLLNAVFFDESEHFYDELCSCEAIFNDSLDLKCHSSYSRLRNPFFHNKTNANVLCG